MKNILITGVCGMVGSHLSDELLKKGYGVIGIDNLKVGRKNNIKKSLPNKKFKFIKGDVLDLKLLKKYARKIDVIVHLAASKKISEKGNALDTLRINEEGTRNVLEVARKRRIKVVFASTSDVYGISEDIPFKESGSLKIGPPTAKRWAYAAAKMYCEQLAFSYYKEYSVPIVILRYFGGFSSRASFSWSGGHLPLFIDAILNNRPVIIHGSGKQTRSMAYVDDIVKGTILAMENPKAIGEIFNIGNDEEMSVIDTAHLVHKIAMTGKKLKIKFTPHKKIFGTYKEIKRRVPDLTKSRKILKYRPKFSLKKAIEITIEEYKKSK